MAAFFNFAKVDKENEPKLPIPKTACHFILDNYGEKFYSIKSIPKKMELLKDISNAISNFGFNYNEHEIERRLKSMRTHYRRKKRNLQKGIVPKVEWEYYAKLDAILTKLDDTVHPSPSGPLTSAIVTPPIKTESDEKISLKRKVEAILENYSDDDEMPIDMTNKKPKLDENNNIMNESLVIAQRYRMMIFDDFKDNLAQLNIDTSSSCSKILNVQGIIEKLKVVDQNRIRIDEERLKLEIHRNELDKIGYELSELMAKIIED